LILVMQRLLEKKEIVIGPDYIAYHSIILSRATSCPDVRQMDTCANDSHFSLALENRLHEPILNPVAMEDRQPALCLVYIRRALDSKRYRQKISPEASDSGRRCCCALRFSQICRACSMVSSGIGKTELGSLACILVCLPMLCDRSDLNFAIITFHTVCSREQHGSSVSLGAPRSEP